MPDFKRLPTVNSTAVSLAGHTHPGAPDELSGLVLWYKANAITGLADGATVTTWADASGNGRDVTQATSGKRPLYKTGIVNGLPVVRFDGTDDTLATAAASFPASPVRTVIVVGKFGVGGADFHRMWGLGVADAGVYESAGTWGYYATEAGGLVDLGGSAFAFSVASMVYASAGSVSGYINGGTATTFDPKDTFSTQQVLALGNSAAAGVDYLDGDIAELVMYGRALSRSERVSIERSLGTKYGITVAGTVDPVTEFATAIKWGTD